MPFKPHTKGHYPELPKGKGKKKKKGDRRQQMIRQFLQEQRRG
jgi:hypothetical protein